MDFIRGLFSVAIIYAVVWGIFQWGFMKGYDDATNDKIKKRYAYNNARKAFK